MKVICVKCNDELELNKDNFYTNPSSKYGWDRSCKKCRIKMSKKWVSENRERVIELRDTPERRESARRASREWANQNKDKTREYFIKYQSTLTDVQKELQLLKNRMSRIESKLTNPKPPKPKKPSKAERYEEFKELLFAQMKEIEKEIK